jgi:ABC-2 type transport system permease protein
MTLRLRRTGTISAAVGLVAVMIAVGALFPAVGHAIGKINVPSGVANLLGGADYGTITGWFRSEIAEIYGPLVIAALAITAASASTAGEEEDRILALILAHPVRRSRLVIARAVAVGAIVVFIAFAVWIGLLAGVAVGGGGAVALALGAGTGRRSLANGGAAAVAILGWLVNSFAPLASGLSWLKYLAPFYYYAGHDPLAQGVDLTGIVVLGLLTLALFATAVVSFERRDLGA